MCAYEWAEKYATKNFRCVRCLRLNDKFCSWQRKQNDINVAITNALCDDDVLKNRYPVKRKVARNAMAVVTHLTVIPLARDYTGYA